MGLIAPTMYGSDSSGAGSGFTTDGVIYAASSTGLASTTAGAAGQVVTSNGPGVAPTYQNPASGSYAQAFTGQVVWSTSSTSFADGTNSGGNAITIRQSSGITLTAAASNIAGVTFTPPSASAVYVVIAQMALNNSAAAANGCKARLTDGSTVIATSPGTFGLNTSVFPTTIFGVYVPGTTSPVTVKVQIAALGGTCVLESQSADQPSMEWTVVRIF